MDLDIPRALRGALAGSVAAGVWAAQQPLDQRLFGVPYDDIELLGKWITRGPAWRPLGLAAHLQNGALVGALYASVAPRLPLPGWALGTLLGLGEHLATWPGTALLPRIHPAAQAFPRLWGSARAFAQATWRHLLFGFLLGILERRLNPPADVGPLPEATLSTNGRGSAERVAVG
jgi:hypothetical protein